MCDPMTLAIAGTAMAVAGTAVTGYMAYSQSKFQQKVADANQKAANSRAAEAIDQGDKDQQTLARKHGALAGQARAAMSANGIDIGYGSAADYGSDLATFYKEDTDTLAGNTMRQVRGIELEAANFGAQSAAAGYAATGALVSAGFDIGSTVLGGIGKTKKIGAAQKAGGSGWGV